MPDAGFRISIGYIERLLTGTLAFLYLEKLKKIREDGNIFINSLLIYFVLFFFLSEFKVISMRFSNLFCYAYWIIWIDLIKCFSINNNRKLFVIFIGIYCILKIYGTTNYVIAKYDNLIFGTEPFHIKEYIFNKNFNDAQKR